MTIVIVYGPQASGKTRRRAQLLKHYQCSRLVDDWNGRDKLRDGDLALTNEEPPFKVAGAQVIDIATAKSIITSCDDER